MKDSTSATWEATPGTFLRGDAVEGLHQRDLGGQNSDVLDLKVGAQRGPRRVRAGVLGPQRSGGIRKLNFYHQVQLRRQHLPAAQDAHHGGAQQHVRVAALVHRAAMRGSFTSSKPSMALLRLYSPPFSRGSGPRRRGAACCWTAPAHGSRTARRRGCLRGCLKCCCQRTVKC